MNNIDNKLLKGLYSDEERLRLYAIEDIIETEEIEYANFFVDFLIKEKSDAVKNSLVNAILKLNNPDCYERLFALYSSSDAFLRNAAVKIMSSYKESVEAFLIYNLNHSNREVRKLILDSIVQIGTQNCLFAIRACLYDVDINVVIAAVEYLGKLKDKNSGEELLLLFDKTTEPMLKVTILEVVKDFADVHMVKSFLVKLIIDNPKAIDMLYISALLKMVGIVGEHDTIIDLINSIEDKEEYADEIIESIVNAEKRFDNILSDKDILNVIETLINSSKIREEFRFVALELLSKSKDEKAIKILMDMAIGSTDPELKEFCTTLIK